MKFDTDVNMPGFKGLTVLLAALLAVCVALGAGLYVSMNNASTIQKELDGVKQSLDEVKAERDGANKGLVLCKAWLKDIGEKVKAQSDQSIQENKQASDRVDHVLSQLPSLIKTDRVDTKTPEQASNWLKALFQ